MFVVAGVSLRLCCYSYTVSTRQQNHHALVSPHFVKNWGCPQKTPLKGAGSCSRCKTLLAFMFWSFQSKIFLVTQSPVHQLINGVAWGVGGYGTCILQGIRV